MARAIYDANNRLTEERLDRGGDGSVDQVAGYGYAATQQTLKEVREGGVLKTRTANEYDLRGRMATVTVETYAADGTTAKLRERTEYGYDASGIRVSSTQRTDATADGTYETVTATTFLSDPRNHTGHAQVLEEVTKDGAGAVTKRVVYAVGHDQVSQTVYDAANPSGVTQVFHADGHGSTRVLTDLVGAVVQRYAFDAYGNALGFDPAQALTSYLYSGEHFDSRIGQQYLRARWYDATTGRFNRLDPFFGNSQDPQSLHKYLYTHADPVNGSDPTGLANTLSVSVALGMAANIASLTISAITAALDPTGLNAALFAADLATIWNPASGWLKAIKGAANIERAAWVGRLIGLAKRTEDSATLARLWLHTRRVKVFAHDTQLDELAVRYWGGSHGRKVVDWVAENFETAGWILVEAKSTLGSVELGDTIAKMRGTIEIINETYRRGGQARKIPAFEELTVTFTQLGNLPDATTSLRVVWDDDTVKTVGRLFDGAQPVQVNDLPIIIRKVP